MDSYRQFSILFIDDTLLLLGVRRVECGSERSAAVDAIVIAFIGEMDRSNLDTTNYVLCNFHLILFVDVNFSLLTVSNVQAARSDRNDINTSELLLFRAFYRWLRLICRCR